MLFLLHKSYCNALQPKNILESLQETHQEMR